LPFHAMSFAVHINSVSQRTRLPKNEVWAGTKKQSPTTDSSKRSKSINERGAIARRYFRIGFPDTNGQQSIQQRWHVHLAPLSNQANPWLSRSIVSTLTGRYTHCFATRSTLGNSGRNTALFHKVQSMQHVPRCILPTHHHQPEPV